MKFSEKADPQTDQQVEDWILERRKTILQDHFIMQSPCLDPVSAVFAAWTQEKKPKALPLMQDRFWTPLFNRDIQSGDNRRINIEGLATVELSRLSCCQKLLRRHLAPTHHPNKDPDEKSR
ncbi:MAG: hypothetical protein ACWA6Y_04120 [Polaromonas sp.]